MRLLEPCIENRCTHSILREALRLMYCAGWVHRDISMGNILIVDDGPKIVDLEYAKRLDDDSKTHQTRTVCVRLLSCTTDYSILAGHRVLHACGDQVTFV